jgi:hypothetical protein
MNLTKREAYLAGGPHASALRRLCPVFIPTTEASRMSLAISSLLADQIRARLDQVPIEFAKHRFAVAELARQMRALPLLLE